MRPLGLGSPLDYYTLSIFLAVNETLDLRTNNTLLHVPPTLLDEWDFNEQLERFDQAPTNSTLAAKGLDVKVFAEYASADGKWADTGHLQDYYLYTVTITPKSTYTVRMALAFLFVPAVILFFLIIVAFKYTRNSLSFPNLLTIYLATAFFTVPFLVSFYQYAPPVTLTWQEVLLLVDFISPTILVLYALATKNRLDRKTV